MVYQLVPLPSLFMSSWKEPLQDLRQLELLGDVRLLSISEELRDLVRTNDVLDGSAKAVLTEDASVLENHIQFLDNLKTRISAARDHAEHCFLWRRSALSPVRSLPDDVLIEIFKLVGSYSYGLSGFTKAHFTHPHISGARTISQVSRRWREVVVSTPALWAKFSIDLQKKVELRQGKYRDSVQMWLDRVGAHPLQLKVSMERFSDIEEDDHQRYKARRQAFYSSVIAPLREAKTQGISLELQLPVRVQTSVEFVGDALYSLGHRITRLNFRDNDLEDGRRCLESLDMPKKSCIVLTKLSVDAAYAHLLPLIRAPNLKKLHLTCAYLDTFSPTICSFLVDSPNLEVLKVKPGAINGSMSWHLISTPSEDGHSIGGALKRLPNLKKMIISNQLSNLVVFLTFLKSINVSLPDNEAILPQLHVLELRPYPEWARRPWIRNVSEVLWQAVQSFKDKSSPLKVVRLGSTCRTEDAENEVERLRQRSAVYGIEVDAAFHVW
jgi:hypothetical protein